MPIDDNDKKGILFFSDKQKLFKRCDPRSLEPEAPVGLAQNGATTVFLRREISAGSRCSVGTKQKEKENSLITSCTRTCAGNCSHGHRKYVNLAGYLARMAFGSVVWQFNS
ncbi:hypothetical protein ZHAS_00020029 [Anopheles sinensis]|uniref:Uncharacterized protein n=1 Tax=Anopheles sinensis TaxID=74873 RepID=A0A084WNQ8_ANOSI|nr:hypothetical protein ZHAS_00020029 [Anopheles sinensis]